MGVLQECCGNNEPIRWIWMHLEGIGPQRDGRCQWNRFHPWQAEHALGPLTNGHLQGQLALAYQERCLPEHNSGNNQTVCFGDRRGRPAAQTLRLQSPLDEHVRVENDHAQSARLQPAS